MLGTSIQIVSALAFCCLALYRHSVSRKHSFTVQAQPWRDWNAVETGNYNW